jgi:hypothetical protein
VTGFCEAFKIGILFMKWWQVECTNSSFYERVASLEVHPQSENSLNKN